MFSFLQWRCSTFSDCLSYDSDSSESASKRPEVSNFVNLKQGADGAESNKIMLGGQNCFTIFISIWIHVRKLTNTKSKTFYRFLIFLNLFLEVISDAKVTHPWFSEHRLQHFSFVVAWKAHDHLQPLSLASSIGIGSNPISRGSGAWNRINQQAKKEMFGNCLAILDMSWECLCHMNPGFSEMSSFSLELLAVSFFWK